MQYGWITGYTDGTFRPEATISRAEVTVIVNHMLGRAADRPYVIAHEEELNTFGDVNRGHWGYFHVAEATNGHVKIEVYGNGQLAPRRRCWSRSWPAPCRACAAVSSTSAPVC